MLPSRGARPSVRWPLRRAAEGPKGAAMAVRRSLNKENRESPRRVRRSLRLENKKDASVSQKTLFAYQRPASLVTDTGTPRTIFKKVLHTQPVVSPPLLEKPSAPKSVEEVQFRSENITCRTLDLGVSDPTPKRTTQPALVQTRSKKKLRLSEFERAVNEQISSNADHSTLDNSSLTKSFQGHFKTPAPLPSPVRKGLTRRPKSYRGVNLKTFEGGVADNLLHVKDTRTYLVDLQTSSLLSDNTGVLSASKQQFATTRRSESRLSVPSPLAKSMQSLAREHTLQFCSVQKPRLGVELNMDVRALQSDQREASTQGAEYADERLGGETDVQSEEEQGPFEDGETGLEQSHPTTALAPSSGHAGRMKAVSEEKAASSERGQEMRQEGNSNMEPSLNTGRNLTTDQSSLDNTSLTKSFQGPLTTPAPLLSPVRKGLTRRPKSYRGVNLKTFEGGVESNLLHVKDARTYLVDLQTSSLLSDNTGVLSASKQQFATARRSESRLSVPSPLAISTQSLARERTLSLAQKPELGVELDVDVRASQGYRRETLTRDTEYADDGSGGEMDVPSEEEQVPLPGGEAQLKQSHPPTTLAPSSGHAGGMKAVSEEKAASSERGQEMRQEGNGNMEPSLNTGRNLTTDMVPARSSTPTNAELPRHSPTSLLEKPTKHSLKAVVADIIQELDRSIPAVLSLSEINMEEDALTYEKTAQITQRTTDTPSRRSSRKTPEESAKVPTVELGEGTTQQTGDQRRTGEVMDTQAEDDVESEAEMDSEDDEISEGAQRNTDPTGSTPAFVYAKAFPVTPLLSGAQTPKVTVSSSLSKQPPLKKTSKPSQKARGRKRESALPRSFVKKMLGHYARMPVAKDAFSAMERCVNLYFKHLSDDLEAYANHAGRKTVEAADLELLMRRQGLVTDKMPLNVLIERHLPLEYRKLLIPVATSGNKVLPRKPL